MVQKSATENLNLKQSNLKNKIPNLKYQSQKLLSIKLMVDINGELIYFIDINNYL